MQVTHYRRSMMTNSHSSGPIVIGGIGGSGTRVVAEILLDCGYFLGNDLNSAHDNLSFTLLFKRPRWFKLAHKSEAQVFKGLSVFEKSMKGDSITRLDEYVFVARATGEIFLHGHDHLQSGRGSWAIERAMTMLRAQGFDSSTHIGWGWKEPNSHIFLEFLKDYFNNLKYIHVIRHGLDMAYSPNQTQLHIWGDYLGVKISKSPEFLPKASLDYWIKANVRAISSGKRILGQSFLLLNFDELCSSPQKELEKLLSFLNLDVPLADMPHLLDLPRMPSSMGRYKGHDLSIFSDDSINAVHELGFIVSR